MSKSGRRVVAELNKTLGGHFNSYMRNAQGLHEELSQSEFIDILTSEGLTDSQAYTLWHSPPMG